MNRATLALTATALLALTGSVASAAQARAHYADDNKAAQNDRASRAGMMDFRKASDLIGLDVVNANGETIASVQDFIADRGDGRITHVLLKSGDVLGIGGKTIAVPYERLSYKGAEEKYRLDMTSEQIERAAEFVPENWADLHHVTWTEKMDTWFNGDDQTADRRDDQTAADVEKAYADSIRNGKTNEIRGTITEVNRARNTQGWEEVTVNVKDKNGGEKTLVLGPSWYVMSQDSAPMRGQMIDAKAVSAPHDNRYIVTSADVGGKNLELRNEQGRARWDLGDDERRSRAEQGQGRLVLVSDMLDADVWARAEEAGDVQDAMVETRSGQIAALGLDPNDNFLGMGDEIKLVPWSLVSVLPSGDVRIDADQTMIKSGQTMPDDVNVFATPARLEPVYSAYGIDVYTFEPRNAERDSSRENARREYDKRDGKHAMPQDASSGAWANDGKLLKAFRNGEKSSVSGKIKSVKTEAIDPACPDARVLTIATDEGDRHVVVGPSWYLDRQDIEFKEGDRVTVSGKKAVVNGKEYTAAWSITTPDHKAVTLWDGDRAVWNAGR